MHELGLYVYTNPTFKVLITYSYHIFYAAVCFSVLLNSMIIHDHVYTQVHTLNPLAILWEEVGLELGLGLGTKKDQKDIKGTTKSLMSILNITQHSVAIRHYEY